MSNNPLSPHLQIYKWHISSLLSISHRIVGVLNFLAIIMICLWFIFLSFDSSNFEVTKDFLNSIYGKFLTVSLIWSFSFHILNEIRHLFWDMGYGFDLKISKITGLFVIIGSFILCAAIYLIGKKFIYMNISTKNGYLLNAAR